MGVKKMFVKKVDNNDDTMLTIFVLNAFRLSSNPKSSNLWLA